MDGQVVIVGAGIGGLATAAVLARRGVRCVVLERATGFADTGAGIQIAPNGSAVLHRLGLAGELAGACRPAERQIRRWSDDATIGTVELGAAAVRRYGSPYYTLRRSHLHRMLLGLVDVRFGAACTGVNDRGDHVVVSLEDGTRLTADVVIGADGLRSVVRRAVVADRLRASGWVAYRAVVPDFPAHGNRVIVRLGPGRHLVSYPLGDGSLNVVAVMPSSLAAPSFDGWHCSALSLVSCAGRFDRYELFDRPRSAWRRGRVVLLGDAAHPLLPFLAQGACQALEDAEAIAKGVENYQAVRASRVARVAAAGLAGAREYHFEDGPSQRARDDRLAAVGLPGQDWLFGYGS
ncbi:FAD-dependent monooxygenase [Paractinoplanes lichenicola]|uniref:FAD-dependent monooxygenase n=1 Tax=Paractinoplanes lichenicola TaxID=2802976 RepID=A0ABS1VY33_9ACTN|nr:FAD-dependent monooxygenase [Actinoplanes lichenicola]MBL7259402.1 FAD-dependent monooxygenase [Actinoplanes lichenicola]